MIHFIITERYLSKADVYMWSFISFIRIYAYVRIRGGASALWSPKIWTTFASKHNHGRVWSILIEIFNALCGRRLRYIYQGILSMVRPHSSPIVTNLNRWMFNNAIFMDVQLTIFLMKMQHLKYVLWRYYVR